MIHTNYNYMNDANIASDDISHDKTLGFFNNGAPIVFDQDAIDKNFKTRQRKERWKKLIGAGYDPRFVSKKDDLKSTTDVVADTSLISWHKYGKCPNESPSYLANTILRADLPRVGSVSGSPETQQKFSNFWDNFGLIQNQPDPMAKKRMHYRTREKLAREALLKKARKKEISYLVADLLSSWCPSSSMAEKYKAAKTCGDTIYQNGKTLISMYCKQRFCPTCNNIRTAKLIEKYSPVFRSFVDPQLVTLTIKNVRADKLNMTIREMSMTLAKIMDNIRKQYVANRAIAKFEVTYNQETDEYHPHLHLICADQISARLLMELWPRAWNPANYIFDVKTKQIIEAKRPKIDRKKFWRRSVYGDEWTLVVGHKGQELKPVDIGGLKELFKYVTKLSVKHGTAPVSNGKKKEIYINPIALDWILRSLPDRFRTFRSYGIKFENDDDPEEIDELQSVIAESIAPGQREWIYNGEDWENRAEGLKLTGYDKTRRPFVIYELEPVGYYDPGEVKSKPDKHKINVLIDAAMEKHRNQIKFDPRLVVQNTLAL